MRMSMHRARRGRRAAVGAVVATMMLSGAGSALAQVPAHRSVESSAKGDPGKPIRLGVYVNVQPDCSSGPLPGLFAPHSDRFGRYFDHVFRLAEQK